MDWWIGIGIYKLKNGEYLVLDIPEELIEAGYKEGVSILESHLLEESEIKKLDKEDYGYYTLQLINKNYTFEECMKSIKKGNLINFEINKFIQRL